MSGAKRLRLTVGATAPSREGPSTMPATISPTTCGWLIFWNTAPTSRATTMITADASRSFHTTLSLLTGSLSATLPPPAGCGACTWRPNRRTISSTTTATSMMPP